MRWALAAAGALTLGACGYHNVLYNARDLFQQGEDARRAGRDSLAVARFEDVARKTGTALRARPDEAWATEALVLLGHARLRLGRLREARAALDRVPASDAVWNPVADVLRAALLAELGLRDDALRRINGAFDAGLPRDIVPEAHLIRGGLFLERGLWDNGDWDLDRASEAGDGYRVEAGVERLRWAVERDEPERAAPVLAALLDDPDASARADTVLALTEAAASAWGVERAAMLLSGVTASRWDRRARGSAALARARYLDAAGDTALALREAEDVSTGLGGAAADARVLMAGWRAERARDLETLYGLRGLLLPVADDERAARLLGALDRLQRLAGTGLDEPLGWFAAGEVARDELGARWVARGLFLAYADGATDAPWAPKALLAALELSPDEGDRAWLRGRLEAHAGSPYVLAATGRSAPDYQVLEEELDVQLRELGQR